MKKDNSMTHKERFFATLARADVDRPACWLGLPTSDAVPALLRHFKVNSIDELKMKIGDDIYPVEVPYHHPPANHIACAFDFAKKSHEGAYEERTLTAPGFFEDYSDPSAIGDFNWPNPAVHMSLAECRSTIDRAPSDMAAMGVMWSAHFQDACAAFGMETALMKMITEPEMFRAVIDRITEFYLKANEIFYEAGKSRLDAVLIGNDFGSQNGLMLSLDLLRELVFPGTKKLIDQAHSHGLKVIHHSCGAVADIIPDLIAMGVDVIHPIQALASGMGPQELKSGFGGKVTFCGGVDAQNLLVNGTPEKIKEKVIELRAIFPTGLIISPSHEAILPDIPPVNIEALFEKIQTN
ncbi:MAG: uroporphyrinogen decarboxylase family protein [Candidatus Paceibacterota bacterium]|jgi:uroporphyrinogen decarboxylase